MTYVAKIVRPLRATSRLRALTIGFAATITIIWSADLTAQPRSISPTHPTTKSTPVVPPLPSPRTRALTFTAPYYAPYKEWMRCADRAIAWAIQNGDNTGENAGKLAAVICSDQLDQLRALLAREVGLVEAGRFYRRSDYDLRETAKDYWRWAHPASPRPSTNAEAAR